MSVIGGVGLFLVLPPMVMGFMVILWVFWCFFDILGGFGDVFFFVPFCGF